MPRPRVWIAVSLICLLVGLFILAANPATSAPTVPEGVEPIWQDVINVLEHWHEGGPRRAGQTLLLFSLLFFIHACVCAWIRKKR